MVIFRGALRNAAAALAIGAAIAGPARAESLAVGVEHTSTAALASSLEVRATFANLHSFEVAADATLSAAAWWLMVWDATAVPADGAVTPDKCYAFPAGTTGANFSFVTPVQFQNGIALAVSTTGCFTKTSSTHAFLSADWQ